MCPVQYSQFEVWDIPGRGLGHGAEREVKIQECPLEFSSSASMHHITFEEGEFLLMEVYHIQPWFYFTHNAFYFVESYITGF